MYWTSFAAYPRDLSARLCVCPSLEFTKSRVLAMSWLAVSSRVSSNQVRKSFSCQRTPPLTLAPGKLKWKMGKETGGKKMEDPHSLKSTEMAQCSFQPQQPLVCDTFKNCEGLSRVAFMDGNGVVMLGKVVSCERKEEGAAAGKKK